MSPSSVTGWGASFQLHRFHIVIILGLAIEYIVSSVVLVYELDFSFSYSTLEQSIFSSSSSYSKASAYLF